MELNFIVKNTEMTINQILKKEFDISTILLNKLIKNKKVLLNGNICDTRVFPNVGDCITVDLSTPEDNSNIVPTNIPLDIIYEDSWLLIVNKPAGIAVHPSILHYDNSLSNGVKFYFDKIGLNKKIRPVNRLDCNTSGLVLFAKCEYIQECLIKQMQANIFKKEYLAICNGIFDEKQGIINLPIARKENSIIERCVSENGQKSITHYNVLKESNNLSLVNCALETGRTHQIRVHMSAIGHPLIGDSLYGTDSDFIDRQALHCYKLQFIHPVTKCNLDFLCSLPCDFKNFDFIK